MLNKMNKVLVTVAIGTFLGLGLAASAQAVAYSYAASRNIITDWQILGNYDVVDTVNISSAHADLDGVEISDSASLDAPNTWARQILVKITLT